ncbi:hypothetical protein RU98_GL002110 [Enterococcus caccae]|nr:hypothetical protein RU98_GL002110 [Enterococcus caccae]
MIPEHQWLKWNPFNMLNIENTIMENVDVQNSDLSYLNFW